MPHEQINMTERKGLVSIGLPVYNGARYLRPTLDALLAQTYERFELIISDNASTDETPGICREYTACDTRIQYHRNDTNLGQLANFKRVMDLARGEYFMLAADHDDWDKEYISRCVEILDNDPSVVLCSTEAAWISPTGELLEGISTRIDTRGLDMDSRFHVTLWTLDNCYPIYGLIRMSALQNRGRCIQSFSPDVLLLTELSLQGAFAYIPARLFYLRRMEGYGNAYGQAERLGINTDSKLLGLRLYLELVWRRCRVASRHFPSLPSKCIVIFSVISVMLIKFRWVINTFRNSRRMLRGDTQDATRERYREHKRSS
jgi:glycosyltransferase involved in cell wall biosynthesis